MILSLQQQKLNNTFVFPALTPFYFREIFPTALGFLVFYRWLLRLRLTGSQKPVVIWCEK